MKVFLHYEDCLEDELRMTIKLTLPKKWKSGPSQRLLDTFCEAYNKKHVEDALEENQVHFEKKDGFVVPFDAPVQSFMESGDDLFLKHGPSKSMEALGFVPKISEQDEKSNGESKPVKEKKSISSMAAARAAADAQLNSNNKSDNMSSSDNKPKPALEEGMLTCKRFGCNKKYKEEDNHDKICLHHTKPPVFHETRKFWSCCPDKIAWDWDSFQEIKGCSVGRHTNEKQTKQQFLGGSDVRKEEEERLNQGVPQRLNSGPKSGLDKLSALRKALIGIGIDGPSFDKARDILKSKYDQDVHSSKIWDKVCEELAIKFGETILNIN